MSDAPQAPPDSLSALPPGTRLGEFEVKSVLGVGGFGIVYLAFDHALEREVAIKEYMPASMAGRTETLHVSLHSQNDAEVFALGRRSFVNEAKLLARFEHPSLIKVYRFWEANGTAYMAMPVLRGRSLKALRRSTYRAPDEALLRGIIEPLLGGLEKLHNEGVFHRDIAPDNVYIEPDGHPVLLDFGAARRVIGDKTQSLTAILKPAYAPIEQYAEAGSVKQGAWTDIYALGATMHFMLLGQPPPPATARAVFDEGTSLSTQPIAGCSPAFLEAIDWMLAPRPADRPQSVAQLREVLQGRARRPSVVAPTPAPAPMQSWERTVMVPPRAPGGAAAPDVLIEPTFTQPPQGMRTVPPPAELAAPEAARSVASPPRSRTVALPLVLVGALAAAGAGWYAWRMAGGAGAGGEPSAAASQAAAPAASMASTATTASTAASSSVNPGAASAPMVAAAASQSSPASQPGAGQGAAAASSPPVGAPAPGPAVLAASAPAPASSAAALPAAAGVAGAAAVPSAPTKPGAEAAAGPAQQAAAPAARPRPASAARRDTTVARPAPAAPAAPAALARQPTVPASGRATPSTATAAGPGAEAAPRAEAEPPDPTPNLTPEARCGGRNPLSYYVCMERECRRPRWQAHADCQSWRRNARPPGN